MSTETFYHGTISGRFPCKHINKSNTPKSEGWGGLTSMFNINIKGGSNGLISQGDPGSAG